MTADSATSTRAAQLEAERAVNEQYMRRLVEAFEKSQRDLDNIPSPRSAIWTESGPRSPADRGVVAPLIGRVVLDTSDEWLGVGVYIGSWHLAFGDVQVVSWAAPVAELFYRGRRSADRAAGTVAARRTFDAHLDDIRNFVDEFEAGVAPDAGLFETRGVVLDVPAPPKLSMRPKPMKPIVPAPEPPRLSEPKLEVVTRVEGLRADELVLDAIERPKTGRLSSVLATLQPDQYRLVTWPDDVPLVVQGQPGTGKTIIATHRAAYLTNAEREPRALERVALVGPTDQYAEHVRAVPEEIASENVTVLSMPQLLRRLVDLDRTRDGGDRRSDTVWTIGRAVERCAAALRGQRILGANARQATRQLVEAFIAGGGPLRPLDDLLVQHSELRSDMRSWDFAREQTRFLPVLGTAFLAVRDLPQRDRFDHIIVDEAQDIRPLEWRVLTKALQGNATFSILGDIHQRHFDWTAPTWRDVAEELELTDDDGNFEPEVLDLGYRSTRQILKYANQLLPRGERGVNAIRDGAQPKVERVGPTQILDASIREAVALAERYSTGLVAIISMAPDPISSWMRSHGWTRPRLPHAWTRDDRTIVVLHPSNARGLEFDSVVVVEPADFPENVGRLGPLYTSLTRATKELAVVYSKALPKGLGR